MTLKYPQRNAMHWIAPSEKDADNGALEKRPWDTADTATRMFAAAAEPMVRRIVQLYTTIQNLRRTRDLLLPRLLSGQVELKTEAA